MNLFVVVFALTGVLGALLRLAYTTEERGTTLWWLLSAIALAITGNVMTSVAGSSRTLQNAASMLSVATFTAVGLFGLDPNGPRLLHPQAPLPERLSTRRLVLLGIAVTAIPTFIGIRELLAGNAAGAMLAVQGAVVAVLVMARIGLLLAERTRAELALEHQATHDTLTNLLNRQELVARLHDELARGARCVILFCDLDDFKSINDRFGHGIGDQVLVEVAHRLRTCVQSPHIVSRFDGDEFVALLIDATPADGDAARTCITTALGQPFDQAGGASVHVSIGLAASDEDRDPDQLIRSADRAMYHAKPYQRADRSPFTRRPQSPTAAQ